MNYLGHFYLSFLLDNNPLFTTGVFMADDIKGKKILDNFPEKIRDGIIFHRICDTYIDNHYVTNEALESLRPILSKWAPVAIDIYWDHFLASNFSFLTGLNLTSFSKDRLNHVLENFSFLPLVSKKRWFYLYSENLPVAYADLTMMELVFKRMHKRIKLDNKLNLAYEVLMENYEFLENLSLEFWKSSIDYFLGK